MSTPYTTVRLFGAIGMTRDGESVHLGPARERECFGILVIRRGTPVLVDQLIADLWGDAAPASAVNVVHTYISRLRRRTDSTEEQGLLRSLRPGYSIDPASVTLDVDEFESDRRTGMAALWAGHFDQAAEALDRALGHWSNAEALHGATGPLATQERRRLDELRIDTLETSLALRLRAGARSDTLAELATLVRRHPFRERLWILLMLGLAREDRRGEALVAYHDLRSLLKEDLGIGPSQRAQDLFCDLLADRSQDELWTEHLTLTAQQR
ncbi:BTAD domain-containing putative transcriptional regulator [Glycomyces sp. NRRL B-16210]|uniref:AfsR/SARP family transcriptional regulator n=1 Tax=Glycomyces sp. NRRL B-16210 TaxID=1463821 RepID=UPI0004C04A2D|nr:BTAD domain-containing putative transcriptional regulator [Glycomyces sp. NRRL B-16210]